MVYTKSGYRRKRSYTKRYSGIKRNLKKSNIFKKKSATSQAKQIYYLNKKLNSAVKRLTPEMSVRNSEFINYYFTFNHTENNNPVVEEHGHMYLYESCLFGSTLNGRAGYVMNGNTLRCRNITISGMFTRHTNRIIGLDNVSYLKDHTSYLKFIICRIPNSNEGRFPDQITQPYNRIQEGASDSGLINGPLISNITAGLKIVKVKVLKLGMKSHSVPFKIVLKNPGLYWRGPHTGATPAYKNEYLIYWQYYSASQSKDADGNVIAPLDSIQSGVKFAFYDIDSKPNV